MALGMIEVFGFATAIVCADAMAKAADVKVVAIDKIGFGGDKRDSRKISADAVQQIPPESRRDFREELLQFLLCLQKSPWRQGQDAQNIDADDEMVARAYL